jgi:hypothetical protein
MTSFSVILYLHSKLRYLIGIKFFRMTVQAKERLIYKGQAYEMTALPLEQYLSGLAAKPKLFSPSTACWRGYYGAWEIKNDKLYLVGLIFYTGTETTGGIEYLFPGQREVFASWFNGDIKILFSNSSVKTSFMYAFNDELQLVFKNGILVNQNFLFGGAG